MKRIITGYGEINLVGEDGKKIMDALTDIAKDNLGVKIEGDHYDAIDMSVYRITIEVEAINP